MVLLPSHRTLVAPLRIPLIGGSVWGLCALCGGLIASGRKLTFPYALMSAVRRSGPSPHLSRLS